MTEALPTELIQLLPRRSGRPPREQVVLLEDKILDTAAALFFSEGYGAASIDEIARRAQIAKRTLYARYENKAALFSAVVHRIIQRMRPQPQATEDLFHGSSITDSLHHIAKVMLHAALSPEAVAMYRMVLAEATRFPELALIMNEHGARQEAIRRIAELLHRDAKISPPQADFAAEQFIVMVVTAPQRRALGLGTPMSKPELKEWIDNTVDLFVRGVH
jgi:AcrR family transcriptional regulator